MLPLRRRPGKPIIKGDEPGTHQRPPARCAASGCAPRGSTSSATPTRAARDPEPLLRAALGGGVDIVQLREKELPRREIELARAHLPPPLRHLQRPLHRQRRPRAGPGLRRRRRPRRPGRHARRRGPRAARAGGDRRPLDPLRGADRRRRRAARRLHQRRPGLGDADQRGPARRSGSSSSPTPPSTRPTPSSRSAASTRRTPPRSSRPARSGSAWCGRSATPRRPAAAAESLRAALGGAGEAPGWLRSARKRKERGATRPEPPRADGARLRQGRGPQPGSARGARAAGRGRAAAGRHDRRGRRGADRALDPRRLPGRGRGRRRKTAARPGRWRRRC